MKALVLSGGGAKGAHSVGVIRHLLGDLQIDYQAFCGVSVGAINAAFLAQYHSGQETEAAANLIDLWLSLDHSKIYRRWKPWGRLHAPWRLSFYDSTPLKELIYQQVSLEAIRTSGKEARVGTVCINSGKYTVFDQNDDDFIDAVLASSSFPGMLTPIRMQNQLWIDGGCKTLSPIDTAIKLGATTIDVITTSPEIRDKKFIETPSIVDILKRVTDLSTDKILSNDIDKVLMHNELAAAGIGDKKVIRLRIFRPKYNLLEDVLDFDPDKIREMIDKGYQDAIDICQSNDISLTTL
jgi:NTE family protein